MINISFFSYKGGAGRTSLLFNTLPFLAQRLNATEQEPIIVLDLDLDSKGLSYLVDRSSAINSIQVLRGDSSIGFRYVGDIRDHPFFSKLVPIGALVGLPVSLDRSILCVTAHSQEGANYLSETNNYDARNVDLRTLNRLCGKFHCKAIVMDTPTGNQLAGEQALSISSKIVTVMRITRQFRKGTEEFLKKKSQGTEFCGKEYIIVPNAVPSTEGTTFQMDSIMEDIRLSVKNSIGEKNIANLSLLENGNMGINEVNLFKFREENLKREIQRRKQSKLPIADDEMKALKMYEFLAEELTYVNS